MFLTVQTQLPLTEYPCDEFDQVGYIRLAKKSWLKSRTHICFISKAPDINANKF